MLTETEKLFTAHIAELLHTMTNMPIALRTKNSPLVAAIAQNAAQTFNDYLEVYNADWTQDTIDENDYWFITNRTKIHLHNNVDGEDSNVTGWYMTDMSSVGTNAPLPKQRFLQQAKSLSDAQRLVFKILKIIHKSQ